MKIYVVGGATYYTDFIKDVELVDSLEEADVVMFTGGEDVDPRLYGCKKHSKTFSNPKRDAEEKAVFEKIPEDKLVVSICRGSQFTCVMNGGKLVQDCKGHALWSTHTITDGDTIYEITSTHHQMQYPYDLPKEDYDVLFVADPKLSYYYEGDGINVDRISRYGEPEIVLYHKKGLPRCLAIQGHPEMIPNSPVSKMINELIIDLLKDDNK